MPVRIELEFRNLAADLIMSVLVEAGGNLDGERVASADGWTAVLVKMPPAALGPVFIPRDMLVIEGDDEGTVRRTADFMRRNLMRGGG